MGVLKLVIIIIFLSATFMSQKGGTVYVRIVFINRKNISVFLFVTVVGIRCYECNSFGSNYGCFSGSCDAGPSGGCYVQELFSSKNLVRMYCNIKFNCKTFSGHRFHVFNGSYKRMHTSDWIIFSGRIIFSDAAISMLGNSSSKSTWNRG